MIVEIRGPQLTLKEFLKLPEFKPALEFIGGRVIQKMSPMLPHSILQPDLAARFNAFARPLKLGRAYTELRWASGGESQVPDASFYQQDRVPKFIRRTEPEAIPYPPDITVEIHSHGQTLGELRAKTRLSLRHDTHLGWLIHPIREEVYVLRPGRKAQALRSGDTLSGEEALPGFLLPVDELFGWLD